MKRRVARAPENDFFDGHENHRMTATPSAISETVLPRQLTPAMRALLERMGRAGRPPLESLPPAQARAFYERNAGVLDIAPAPLPRVQDVRIPARDGAALHARLYAPRPAEEGPPLPALLYLHGGGFTLGSVATHESLCRALAAQSGVAVLALDYRLAPEHRFPTAVHDAWDALRWLAAEGAALGLDASRLAVGGDSAGGTLAAVAAIHARDEGLPLALQLLIYPGTTAHQDTESHQRLRHAPPLTEAAISWLFGNYIAPHERTDWRFAPLLHDDLAGVAPAWLALAECDPLVDEGLAYADKLRMAGVPVQLELYRGMVHGFIQFGRVITEALTAQKDAAAALAQALLV